MELDRNQQKRDRFHLNGAESLMGRISHSLASAEIVPVIEDDQAVAAYLSDALKVTGHAVAQFDSGEAFLASKEAQKAHCAVCAMQLSGMSGIEVLKRVREFNRTCKFVLVAISPRIDLIVEAMRSGAATVLDASCDAEVLRSAVAEARALSSSPVIANEVVEHRKRLASLSPGERQVLAKLVEGVPHKKIASQLDVGLRTVELRKARAMQKVGAATVAKLIEIATVVRLFDNSLSQVSCASVFMGNP